MTSDFIFITTNLCTKIWWLYPVWTCLLLPDTYCLGSCCNKPLLLLPASSDPPCIVKVSYIFHFCGKLSLKPLVPSQPSVGCGVIEGSALLAPPWLPKHGIPLPSVPEANPSPVPFLASPPLGCSSSNHASLGVSALLSMVPSSAYELGPFFSWPCPNHSWPSP